MQVRVRTCGPSSPPPPSSSPICTYLGTWARAHHPHVHVWATPPFAWNGADSVCLPYARALGFTFSPVTFSLLRLNSASVLPECVGHGSGTLGMSPLLLLTFSVSEVRMFYILSDRGSSKVEYVTMFRKKVLDVTTRS
jgi:hypothetical protein